MVNLKDLLSLEKHVALDPNTCNVVQQETDEQLNISTFVLEKNGKHYYRVEEKGKVQTCCEILAHWKPWPHITVYAFTPDDLHIYELETGRTGHIPISYLQLEESSITPGLSCNYNGQTLEYVDETHLKFNGRTVKVEHSSDFCHKPLKTKILGFGGAKGVFRWLENIAEEGRHVGYPFWHRIWAGLFDFYAPTK